MNAQTKSVNDLSLQERVVTPDGTGLVTKLFCTVPDRLVEIELREDQVLKLLIRKSLYERVLTVNS